MQKLARTALAMISVAGASLVRALPPAATCALAILPAQHGATSSVRRPAGSRSLLHPPIPPCKMIAACLESPVVVSCLQAVISTHR